MVRRTTIRVLGAIAVGAAVLCVGVGALVMGFAHLRSDANSTVHVSHIIERLDDVQGSVVDAETGVRGYVITRNALFLAPLRSAAKALPSESAALAREIRSDPSYEPAVRALNKAAEVYVTDYANSVVALVRTDPARA